MAAQVVTKTESTRNQETLWKITWDWQSTDTGAVTSATSLSYTGQVVRYVAVPDGGGTQPSDQYDVTIVDDVGDVLNGLGANMGNAATVQKCEADKLLCVKGSPLTLNITNAGNAKGGIIHLYIRDMR